MPWLTPDSIPGAAICRPLMIPASREWLAVVNGALQELALEYNWEQFGSVTVAEAVETMQAMLDTFYQSPCGGGAFMAIGASVMRTTNQSWGYGTATAWQASEWNTGAWNSGSPDRLTAPEDGLYEVGASIAVYNTTVPSETYADLQLNGSTVINRVMRISGTAGGLALIGLHVVMPLSDGDYVRVVHPTLGSGGTYTLQALASYSPRFWLVKLGELD